MWCVLQSSEHGFGFILWFSLALQRLLWGGGAVSMALGSLWLWVRLSTGKGVVPLTTARISSPAFANLKRPEYPGHGVSTSITNSIKKDRVLKGSWRRLSQEQVLWISRSLSRHAHLPPLLTCCCRRRWVPEHHESPSIQLHPCSYQPPLFHPPLPCPLPRLWLSAAFLSPSREINFCIEVRIYEICLPVNLAPWT